MVPLNQFNHRHVGFRRVRLLDRSSEGRLVLRHNWLLSTCGGTTSAILLSGGGLLRLLILLLIRSGFPAAWARLQYRIVATTIVWNSASR